MDEKTTLVTRDEARKELLDKCEMQIAEGKRRGQEAVRMIAKALNKIRSEQLYLDVGKESFNSYVEENLGMERHTAQHICEAYGTIKTLEDAGIEASLIPAIESQLVLLSKIPPRDLPKVWTEGVRYLTDQGKPVTTSDIRAMVDFALSQAQAKERPGVNPELKIGDQDGQEARTSLSEDAEIALERIGRLAGKATLQAIEKGTIQISDRDLIRWAEQSDQMVKNLAYYIVGERWSLKKALQYEEDSFNERTTLADLALFATARGGEYRSEFSVRDSTWECYIKKSATLGLG